MPLLSPLSLHRSADPFGKCQHIGTDQSHERTIGYLKDLGISHVYCSPYLEAAKGSLHGYDVVDHQKWLRMERGTISVICNLGELEHGFGVPSGASVLLASAPNFALPTARL